MSENKNGPYSELEDPGENNERIPHERHDERHKALDLAWKQLETAETDDAKQAALNNIARMREVQDEFERQFPETFPPEDE